MLVHICCAVDSHYFLEKIQEEFPDEKLVGYFYDPNIHPYSEYRLRYLDVEYS
ncbi:MAG: epoxyqueuosine reductase QueH, partial [Arcobacter sp.]|nr:epoxyqueuosine reductase QueH [Arcobacter sp.]